MTNVKNQKMVRFGRIEEILPAGVRTIGVAGHVNPDADCVGSTTALCQYLEGLGREYDIDLYLEEPKDSLKFLPYYEKSKHSVPEGKVYDLFVTCDVSSPDRIGVASELFTSAKKTVCLDHHISNPGFADKNHVVADASSCCEVLADLLDLSRVDKNIAESLYTGIVGDTGVFQYSNTSPHTMRVAADLMEKGIDHNKLIDDSFNRRTFDQNRIMGYALEHAVSRLDGQVIASVVTEAEMKQFGVTAKDLDMIVSQLRLTTGAEAAIFLYQKGPDEYKISLRSNNYLDVASVAMRFGGGGHIRAAGASAKGTPEEIISQILDVMKPEIKGAAL